MFGRRNRRCSNKNERRDDVFFECSILTDARLDPSEQATGNLHDVTDDSVHDVTDDSVYHRAPVGSD